jgi:hypothetical protein
LLAEEMVTKPSVMPYKNLCKNYLTYLEIPNDFKGLRDHLLLPRNPRFMSKVKYMQLPNYKILNPVETIALLQKNETKKLIYAVLEFPDDSDSDYQIENYKFHHIARQQVGNIKCDFLNCTDYVISLNSQCEMMINNKLTNKLFIPTVDCQMLIYSDSEHIYFCDSLNNDAYILRCYCDQDDLKSKEDFTNIIWYQTPDIPKNENFRITDLKQFF